METDEMNAIFRMFFDDAPASFKTVNTSVQDSDFRETVIVQTESGGKYVVKLADNDFTFPGKIGMWQRTAREYRNLGYYAPNIYSDRTGQFPIIRYKGHNCVACAEEFAPYRSLEDRSSDSTAQCAPPYDKYREDIWAMTAKVAARHFDYTQYPSAYCLFTTFCPSDKTDEVLENAVEWKRYAETLPREFQGQAQRIWHIWWENRNALEKVYPLLPTSVFQADLNPTNILIDDQNRFVGVFDFNLCGREVFLNYLMRENYGGFEKEIGMIRDALAVSCRYYDFSEAEKEYALMLYRCLKPLWYNKLNRLKELSGDENAVRAYLDETEYYLTAPIDFKTYMG